MTSKSGGDDPITEFLALHDPDGRFIMSFDPNDYPVNGKAIVANLLELQRLIRAAINERGAEPALLAIDKTGVEVVSK